MLRFLICFLPAIAVAAPDFEKEIVPILEATCLSCHDSHEKKGGLDLSTKATAEKALTGENLLLEMVSGPNPEMPKRAKPLTDEQINTLRDWIAAGAQWPENRTLVHNPERDLDWWSLRPIKTKVYQVQSGSVPGTVDTLLGEKLNEKGLKPVPPADPLTMIRRVTYDLTGLPPTPEEIDTFLADPDWEKLVDRLLASSAFGEKFAQHWLDLARYAETHGYDKDKPRNSAWPYRDYVIRSFNEDKPFTRFVREQVAGDVLYPDDADAITALGFLAAGPWDFIGHWEVGEAKLDGRIAKHLDRDEMISAVFNVFQSTTVQCAQCHHHKFDPIRMEDYYRLHAVFAAVDRADRVYDGLPPELQKRKNEINSRLTELKQEQEKLTTQIKRLVAAKASGIDRRIAELREKYGTGSGPKPQYGYHSSISKNQNEQKWVQVDLGKPRSATEVMIMPAFDNYNNIGAGFGFPLRYRIEVANDVNFETGVRMLFDGTRADQPNPKKQTLRISGDGQSFRYLRFTATKLAPRKNDYILALGEIEIVNEGGADNFARSAEVTAKDTIESGVRWGRKNLVDGIYFREVNNQAAAAELATLEAKRSEIEKSLRPPETDKRLAEIAEQRGELEKELKTIPAGRLVYAAATHFPRGGRFTATGGKPRPIHLLHRGDMRSPGDLMAPGVPPLWSGITPTLFDTPEWDEGEARAGLARYLTQKDNPLLWRSISNRIWQWVFGAPLVSSPNDFGRGGMEPSHPELLDFLAATLRDDPNQSLKNIVKMLISSDAYRRSVKHDSANAAIDADNQYLWRANRRRLTAEEFRDSLLQISGVLNRETGGPGFQDFVIEKPQHSPHYQYHLHDPDDPQSHRRTIYRFVVRSQPQPMLTTLDCADPGMSVPARDESTTALQALTQWNHRFVEAMARKLALRLEGEENKVEKACRLALGRKPTEGEHAILSEYIEQHGDESFARVLFNMNAFVYLE